MSIHLSAKEGQIAKTVLLPGDPLRAKFIAETYFENVICYNNIRGMLGFTGTYKGKKVSVQGTGIGIPSISLYVNELISSYGAKNLIRVGTCGAMQSHLNLSDIVLAQAACTDSSMNKIRFHNLDFSPIASFHLLKKAYEIAEKKSLPVNVGNVFTTDSFYTDDKDAWKLWAKFNVLVVEMETAALYTLAAKFSVNALSILTISDSMITGEQSAPEEREKNYTNMIEIALEAAEN